MDREFDGTADAGTNDVAPSHTDPEVQALLDKAGISLNQVEGKGSDPPEKPIADDRPRCINRSCKEFNTPYPEFCFVNLEGKEGYHCPVCHGPTVTHDVGPSEAIPAPEIGTATAKVVVPNSLPVTEFKIDPQILASFEVPAEKVAAADLQEKEDKLQKALAKLDERLEMSATASEFPQYPADLIKQFYSQKITKNDVDRILGVFTSRVDIASLRSKVRSIVVTDSSDKQGMKKAREARLAIRPVRVALEHLIDTDVEEHRRKWQVGTGCKRHIHNLLRDEEDYLQFQEDFEKNEQARLKEELRLKRYDELLAVECESLPVIKDQLAEYEESAYAAVLAAATEKFNYIKELEAAEQKRKEAEAEKQRRKPGRINRLSSLGLTFNGGDYVYRNVVVPVTVVDHLEDEAFNAKVEETAALVATAKELEKAEQDDAAKILGRKTDLVKLGFTCGDDYCTFEVIDVQVYFIATATDQEWADKLSKVTADVAEVRRRLAAKSQLISAGLRLDGDSYIYEGTDINVPASAITLPENEFTTVLSDATERIRAHKTAAAQALRLQQEQEETAKALKRAPDKEKLQALITALKAVEFPEVDDKSAKLIVDTARRKHADTIDAIETGLETLLA